MHLYYQYMMKEETKIGKMSWKINAEDIMVGVTTRR